MTTHERMTTAYDHREADRVPITDWLWESTWARWQTEGLPEGAGRDSLGLEDIVALSQADMDASPRFEAYVIEETDTYRIERDCWGITKKNFKPVSTTPMYMDFEIRDRKTWEAARERMTPARDRINWQRLEDEHAAWRARGAWIMVSPWFGWDVVKSRTCGTDTILYAMADDPAWVADMCNHGCDLVLALLDMIWEAGYTFDELMWYDDMAYRNGLFFSKKMWREMLQPYQQRTIDWAHAHGIKAHLHCCGDIKALIPELIDMGLDVLNPMEVKAGMDPLYMKRTYGRDLVLRGGCDARNWSDWSQVEPDIRRLVPAMKQGGGYIFTSDHSIPDYTSLETYRTIVALVKELGAY